MDPKYIAILGAGVIGAGTLILMGQPSVSQAGGAFGGGASKKEVATAVTTEPALTTETLVTEPLPPIYNITMPAPDFPAIPQPAITEPWWVTSLEPPAPAKTVSRSKKEKIVSAYVASEPRLTSYQKRKEIAKKQGVEGGGSLLLDLLSGGR